MEKCPDCGVKYVSVGDHIGKSNCSRPDLTKKQLSIIRGCLLGDGYIRKSGSFELESIQKEYINYLENNFSSVTQHAKLYRSRKENMEQSLRETNPITTNKDLSSYNKSYRYLSTVHHDIKNLREKWYTPEKTVPKNFSLNSLEAKMWYVGDGSKDQRRDSPDICIYTRSENKKREANLLRDQGFDVRISSHNAIEFNQSESKKFLNWIGDPIPGFKYKW